MNKTANTWRLVPVDAAQHELAEVRAALESAPVVEDSLTPKQAWWAGYRAGKGLPPDTPRQDAVKVGISSARLVTRWPDGTPRDERDIASDPEGKLIYDPASPLRAASAPVAKPKRAPLDDWRVQAIAECLETEWNDMTPASAEADARLIVGYLIAYEKESNEIEARHAAEPIDPVVQAIRNLRASAPVAGEAQPVAYRVLRKTHDGDWKDDGRCWCDGAPSTDLKNDIAQRADRWRIEYAYDAPQASAEVQPNAEIVALAREGVRVNKPGTPEYQICAELRRLARALKKPRAGQGERDE